MRKKYHLTLALIFSSILCGMSAQAQTATGNEKSNPTLVGFDYQIQEFQLLNQAIGDDCQCLESTRLNKRSIQSVNLSLFKMKSNWAWEAALGYASGNALNDDQNYYPVKLTQTRVNTFYHFYQAVNRLRPFVGVGVQLAFSANNNLVSIPVGVGLRYRLGSSYVHWQTSYDYGVSANLAQNLITQVGIHFSLNKAKKATDNNTSSKSAVSAADALAATKPIVPAEPSVKPVDSTATAKSPVTETDKGQLAANVSAAKPTVPVPVDPNSTKENVQQPQLAKVVYFDTDKWSLAKSATSATLNEVLAFVKMYPTTQIVLSGHTDAVLDQAYNIALSKRRVEAVKAWLLAQGISNSRITISFSGESLPASNNETEEGRALNRRVEIKVQ
jgi:outer membrane protein OmpA-like peptidoglycan-associated protein